MYFFGTKGLIFVFKYDDYIHLFTGATGATGPYGPTGATGATSSPGSSA